MPGANGKSSGVGPLSHITVLDMCHARAGPTCVRVLADHGAEVIQVVRPAEAASSMDASFPGFDRENLHRNKRSIAIDLQTEAGRAVLHRLVRDADVLVENYRRDVKYRLGFGYETLKAINPRIILASLSGFGQDGPIGHRPGVDQIAQGMGGLMSVTGEPGSGFWRVGIPIADLTSGMYLAHGVLAALIERERSGEGQWVHTSLLEAQIAMLDFQATRWLIGKEVPPQAGNDHPTGFPTGVFPTSDGIVNVAASGGRMLKDFLTVVGRPELFDDLRFATGAARAKPENRQAFRDEVEPNMRKMTTAEVVEKLNDVGVPSGPIYTIDQTFAEPQVQHLKMAQTVQSDRYGPLDIVRSPTNLSRTPTTLRRAAPAPGQHTEEVLRERGFSSDEIAALTDSGAIGMKHAVAAT